MKITSKTSQRLHRISGGFSLIEMMFATGIIAVVFIAMYGSFNTGFMVVQSSREDTRATQILLNAIEEFRTMSWSQLEDTNALPSTFSATYAPSETNQGWTYTGAVTVQPAPISESYSNQIKLVTVEVTWNAGNRPKRKSVKTLVSQYGIGTYIY